MKTFLAQFSKQVVAGAVVLLVVFFVWPSYVLVAAGGFIAGAVAGNFFPALEARAEDLIAKRLKK